MHVCCTLRVVPIFLRDSRGSETRARVKSNHAREDKTLSPPRLAFVARRGMIFTRARVSLSLLFLSKMGTTRSLSILLMELCYAENDAVL